MHVDLCFFIKNENNIHHFIVGVESVLPTTNIVDISQRLKPFELLDNCLKTNVRVGNTVLLLILQ